MTDPFEKTAKRGAGRAPQPVKLPSEQNPETTQKKHASQKRNLTVYLGESDVVSLNLIMAYWNTSASEAVRTMIRHTVMNLKLK
jgi:hypothetical protein